MNSYPHPHDIKENYRVLAYITSAPITSSSLARVHRVKRLSDNLRIERGEIVLFGNERCRVIRFVEFPDDLGVELKVLNKLNTIIDAHCSQLTEFIP